MGYYDPDYYSGAGYVFEWEGRQLVSMWYCYFSEYGEYYESSDECIFTYNADGIRTSKTAQGTTYEYILNGSQVIGQKWVRRDVEHLMLFVYDETGAPIGIKYRKSTDPAQTFSCYFFEKNLQGDIVAIYDSTGRKIGAYTYDAWGVCNAQGVSGNSAFETNLLELYNPFRYRGYFYDAETKYYYLQSRYYNPEWCRFLNADGLSNLGMDGEILSYNLFTYCGNNPVMGYDPTGEWDWGVFLEIVTRVVTDFIATMAGLAAADRVYEENGNLSEAIKEGRRTKKNVDSSLNNAVNKAYYYFADGSTGLDESGEVSAYVNQGYISRWDRLKHAKHETGHKYYDDYAKMYYGEYTLHMYGWFALSWADKRGIPVLSELADDCRKAEFIPFPDDRWHVRLPARFIAEKGW
ncbi:MAG: RHS repeat-associated core domain-containing protein [Ruminococcaceae bacterium]|nr:RHS repeat-associated core domain-containing protein [Oscillospiraceae bacterium]